MAVDDLRANHMMAHLLDALDRGQDIGHYGRLVFAMIARHFLTREELSAWLGNGEANLRRYTQLRWPEGIAA